MRTAVLGLALSALVTASTLLADERVSPQEENSTTFAVVGGHIVGHGKATLVVRAGRIEEITAAAPSSTLRTVDATGRYLAPAFIDSHVHLAYRFSAPELARGGIAAAVDLAAPMAFLTTDLRPLRTILAGPMVTAPTGYPTRSWGSDGYGLEIRGTQAARAAVDRLHAAGARVIKLPVGDATGGGALSMPKNPAILSDQEMKAIADQAHSYGMRVVAHALNDIDVLRAAVAGVDVLAHTPTDPLSDPTVQAWSGRAVISTLAAFPDLAEPAENLRRLRAGGATVLYGTDMGYTTFTGINPQELELLGKAGLDNRAILAAGTTVPAQFWGFGDGLGTLAAGHAASFLILDADPQHDLPTLSRPVAVYLDGVLLPPITRQSEAEQAADSPH